MQAHAAPRFQAEIPIFAKTSPLHLRVPVFQRLLLFTA
ncbi:unnamed protein product [Rhodiola kirilowii]